MVGVNVPIPVPMAFHSFGGWKARYSVTLICTVLRCAVLYSSKGCNLALADRHSVWR